jgi:multidrug efflux system membrane fusion protein
LEEIQRHMGGGRLVVEATGQEDAARVERGVLTFIDNNVDSTTGTIKLKGTFENTMRRLWPGEYANVTLKLSTQANALVIPNQAMQTGQDGTYVYLVKEDRTVEVRPITVGLRRESDLVIASGLSEGETVVTQGQLRLAPGSRVSLPGEGGGGRGRNGGDAPAAEGPGNGAAKEGGKKKSES